MISLNEKLVYGHFIASLIATDITCSSISLFSCIVGILQTDQEEAKSLSECERLESVIILLEYQQIRLLIMSEYPDVS